MRGCDFCKTFDGYAFRHIRPADAEDYYAAGFSVPDPEGQRLTGSRAFSREEVISFFTSCIERDDRADFLLIAPGGRIVGESVLNEYDPETKSCNFRICIFSPKDRDRGLGKKMIDLTLEYAFSVWSLHRVSLEVFSFNPRAEHVYLQAGFRREGVLRDAVRDGDRYGDIILMSILEDEWRAEAR